MAVSRSPRIQRQIRAIGIPRLYRSAGTSHPETVAKIEDMVTELIHRAVEQQDDGARHVLHDLHEGRLTFVEALATFRESGLKGLRAQSKTVRKSAYKITMEALNEYLNGAQLAETTRRSYRNNFKTMAMFAGVADTMHDLPAVLTRYRAECVKLNRNYRAFNLSRSMCQGWLKSVMGEDSDTYASLSRVKSLKRPLHLVKAENQYFSPTDIKNICARLPEDLAAMLWFQLVHCMNHKEMAHDGFEVVNPRALKIFGQKNVHRYGRVVPLMMEPPTILPLPYNQFWAWLRAAARAQGFAKLGTHDLRRSGMRWQTRAGIPFSTVQQFAGQKAQTVTDTYLYSETSTEFDANWEKYDAYLKRELEAHKPSTNLPQVRPKSPLVTKRQTMAQAMESAKPVRPVKRSRSPMAQAV